MIDTASVLVQKEGAMVICSEGMAPEIAKRLEKYIFPMDKVQVADVTSSTKCAPVKPGDSSAFYRLHKLS
jgi:hypothetical protein